MGAFVVFLITLGCRSHSCRIGMAPKASVLAKHNRFVRNCPKSVKTREVGVRGKYTQEHEEELLSKMKSLEERLAKLEKENRMLKSKLIFETVSEKYLKNPEKNENKAQTREEQEMASAMEAMPKDAVPFEHTRHPNVQTPDEHQDVDQKPSLTDDVVATTAAVAATIEATEEAEKAVREAEELEKNIAAAEAMATWTQLMQLQKDNQQRAQIRQERARQEAIKRQRKQLMREQKNRERRLRNIPTKPAIKDVQTSVDDSKKEEKDERILPEFLQGKPQAKLITAIDDLPDLTVSKSTIPKELPTTGYFSMGSNPVYKWEQTKDMLTVTVYFMFARFGDRSVIDVDFQENSFKILTGPMYERKESFFREINGKIMPNRCFFEWYEHKGWEIVVQMEKSEDMRYIWEDPVVEDKPEEGKPDWLLVDV